MKKYSKTVSKRYSQLEKRETYQMEKYIGRLARCCGEHVKVVGYSKWCDGLYSLIVDGNKIKDQCWCWGPLDIHDVVFENCECYRYVGIQDLVDLKTEDYD